jgi:hypothetical protein
MTRMNDFRSEPRELRRQELAAIERELRSGRPDKRRPSLVYKKYIQSSVEGIRHSPRQHSGSENLPL